MLQLRFIYQLLTLTCNAKDGHLAWVDGVIKMTDDDIATDVDEDTAEPTDPTQPVIPVLVPSGA